MKSFDTKEELIMYCLNNDYTINNSKKEIIDFIKNNQNKYLYLRGADLSFTDLLAFDLKGAFLRGADLKRTSYMLPCITSFKESDYKAVFDNYLKLQLINKNSLESNSKVYSEIAKIKQNRQQMHGAAQVNFEMIAKLWSAYTGVKIDSKDVGFMMAMLKAARHKGGDSNNLDNFVDAANYIALAGDF